MSSKKLIYELLLVGDTGNVKRHQPDSLLELLRRHLPDTVDATVLFLGDNIYPHGLPAQGDKLRQDAEAVLNAHHKAVEDFKGQVAFISGNHDWNKGKRDGLSYVLRQEDYLNNLFGKEVYFPPKACPGPSLVFSNPHLALIAINTQWWVQKGEKPTGKKDGCLQDSEEAFFVQLKSLLQKHASKRLFVCGHYPIYSYSLHGGSYKLKHHLFPLTIYKKGAYLPMPVVGSLLPLYRKYYGAREDLSHPRFKQLRRRLKAIFREFPGLTYIAGHEHNLQFIEKYENNYVVSGAGSKATYVVRNGKYSRFAAKEKGFFKIKVYDDLSAKAEVLAVDEENADGHLLFDGWMR